MIAIMTVRTATRFIFGCELLFCLLLLLLLWFFLLLLMKYPPVPFYYGTRAHYSLRELLSPVL